LVCSAATGLRREVGNVEGELSTSDEQLRTKYWELCTIPYLANREATGAQRRRKAQWYCWLPRVGDMLGRLFVGIASERCGETDATFWHASSIYSAAWAEAVAGAVSGGASGDELSEFAYSRR